MPKIYISNNYFIIEDDNGLEYEGHAKDVLVRRENATSDNFSFTGVNGWEINNRVALADITKQDGNAYTLSEFQSFYKEGTGKSSGGGSGDGTARNVTLSIPEIEANVAHRELTNETINRVVGTVHDYDNSVEVIAQRQNGKIHISVQNLGSESVAARNITIIVT